MADAAADTTVWTAARPHEVVVLPAEIDLVNCGAVEAELAAALARGTEVVIADGSRLEFCDCAAIAALVRQHERATAAGAELRIVVTSGHVRRVLGLLGADDVLLLYASLGLAQARPRSHHPSPQPPEAASPEDLLLGGG